MLQHRKRWITLAGVLLVLVTGLVLLLPAIAQDDTDAVLIEPVDLPADFFVPSDVIEDWRANGDIESMRQHGWDLWYELNRGSGQEANGVELPVWETWFSDRDIARQIAGVSPDSSRDFQAPEQHTEFTAGLPVFDLVLEFNKYSPASADFLLNGNADSQRQPYGDPQTLADFQAGNLPPGENRCGDSSNPQTCTVVYPDTAVNLKPVFHMISAEQPTAIPVWFGLFPADTTDMYDGLQTVDWEFSQLSETGPAPNTWLQCAVVDPTGSLPVGEIVEVDPIDSTIACTRGLVVSLESIYHFTLTEREANMLNNNGVQPNKIALAYGGETAQVQTGDYAALVAMHTTTRETDQWAWQTFWWNPPGFQDNSSPVIWPPDHASAEAVVDEGAMYPTWPGSTVDRPDKIEGAWANYAMCTNYMFVFPAQPLVGGDQGQAPELCFNPYLEAEFSSAPGVVPAGPYAAMGGGINSNCLACHGNANVNFDPAYISAQYIPRNEKSFFVQNDEPLLQLDFSWGLQTIAGEVTGLRATPTPEAAEEEMEMEATEESDQ